MGRYRDNPQAIRALVRPGSVHRDLYLDPELFELELEHLWRNTWVYVGHDSQVPNPGDYYTTQIGREPVIMLRGADGSVRVLPNRCAHKGSKLISAVQGRCAGGALRCPSTDARQPIPSVAGILPSHCTAVPRPAPRAARDRSLRGCARPGTWRVPADRPRTK